MTENVTGVVQLDGLVLLKIIKHCQENLPEIATGQLLGLDVGEKLEVTHSFPVPDEADDDYRVSMLKQLRDVNVDNNVVGWYVCSFLGSWMQQDILEEQYKYQKEINSSIMIVYDSYSSTKGKLALKAYRLTKGMMKLYDKQSEFTQTDFCTAGIEASDVVEEVPIKVHNSNLIHGFLYELREYKAMNCDFDRLNHSTNQYLTKNLAAMSQCIDGYISEQGKFLFHLRQLNRQKIQQNSYKQQRQQENDKRITMGQEPLPPDDLKKHPAFKPIPEPQRFETYLISNQITLHANYIAESTAKSFHKLYAMEAVMKYSRDKRKPKKRLNPSASAFTFTPSAQTFVPRANTQAFTPQRGFAPNQGFLKNPGRMYPPRQ